MAITKIKKNQQISELKENLSSADCVVLVHYRGMNAKQLFDMRVNLKSKGCNMKIAKNTLTSLVFKDSNFGKIAEHLKGPTAILFSQDPVALAKVVSDFKKECEFLKILVGYLDQSVLQESDIANLAKLGSLSDVRASFLGTLNAVQSNFVRVLNAPQSGFASLLHNYAESKKE